MDEENVSKILRKVPPQKGFHFYRCFNDPTWIVATSLEEFMLRLRSIEICSVEFHFQHQDFMKWIGEVIGDNVLSKEIGCINRESHGEELREQLIRLVNERLEELREIEAANSDKNLN